MLELEIFFPPFRRQGPSFFDFGTRVERLEKSRAPAIERLIFAYDQIYADAMGDPDDTIRQFLVKSTLKLALCSFRSFTTQELTFLVTIDLLAQATKSGNNAALDVSLVSERAILQMCSNFVIETTSGPTKIVKLAHLSVRQYLEEAFQNVWKRRGEHFTGNAGDEYAIPQQHLHAALSCLHLLNDRHPSLEAEFGSVRDGLLPYARRFWSIHTRNASGSPDLDLAISRTRGETQDPFSGKLEEVYSLIASKSPLGEPDAMGNTPLHAAILDGHIERVVLLLSVDMVFGGKSPLVQSQTRGGHSPLHIAASRGFDLIFRTLLRAGADIQAKDKLGLTALHLAVLYGENDIIRTAAEAGVGLDAPDQTGGTPLHTAAFCNPGAYQLLVDSGADREVLNSERYTPSQVKMYGEYWQRKMLGATSPTPIDTSNRTETAPNPSWKHSFQRPRIVIETRMDCRYCDIERWLEGSRNGATYAHCSSVYELQMSAEKGCHLCGEIKRAVLALGQEQVIFDIDAADIKVGAFLTVDRPRHSAGQDLLVCWVNGVKCLELEFCISESGGPCLLPHSLPSCWWSGMFADALYLQMQILWGPHAPSWLVLLNKMTK